MQRGCDDSFLIYGYYHFNYYHFCCYYNYYFIPEKISGNQSSLFSPLNILSNKHSSHKSFNHGIFTVGISLKYWSTLADTKTKSADIESRGLLLYYVISVLISNPFSCQTRNTRTALETREDNLVEFATCESPFPVLQGECS